MRRWLVLAMVTVLLAAGGCGSSRRPAGAERHAHRSGWDSGDPYARRASEYLEGFMDGYNSAFPERRYSKDLRAYHGHHSCRRVRHNPYRAGWDSGHHTGTNDERRRP